ncbi:MAG: hypothetical protein EBR09_14880 [Proteobacteria bacterium]|nr:hypothetical protein [Pseudomonadota bacterium]
MATVYLSTTVKLLCTATLLCAVQFTVACTKTKTMPAVEQDALTASMNPHNFASGGYEIISGGWSAVDFKGHILPDERYGKENFFQFDVGQKQLQFFNLDGETRSGILPPATAEDRTKAEAALAELLRTNANVNTGNALISFLRLGALSKDFNIGSPKPLSMGFTIVTNRDELPYSPKPNSGPEWNQFIREYCGGFQQNSLGYIWIDGNRKYCLKVWNSPNRQLMKIRALVSLPRSHTSSALDARVSPWITLTRTVTPPPPAIPAEATEASATPPAAAADKK